MTNKQIVTTKPLTEARKREILELGELAMVTALASLAMLESDLRSALAEIKRMRPVLDAASDWRDAIDDTTGPADGDGILGAAIALSDAVDAYRKANP